jgi:hypothetical protein
MASTFFTSACKEGTKGSRIAHEEKKIQSTLLI